MSDNGLAPPVTLIRPSRGWTGLRLHELWSYREVVYFLAWKDVKLRYKQSVLGVAWAVLQPFLMMVAFTIFFNRVAGVSAPGGFPYPVFSYAALVPWTFFASGLTLASNSLVANSNMIKKIYFPRLALPLSSVLAPGFDFVWAFLVLVGMLVFYRIAPTTNVLFLPYFFLLALVASLGVGLWLSAMNLQFRDVAYVVPFLLQIWLIVSPVIYSAENLAQPWKTIYALNPMAGVIEGFRWALLGGGPAPVLTVVLSTVTALAVLVSGAFYFRRLERTFADVV